MKKCGFILFLMFFINTQICFAQNDLADSLLQLAETSSGIKKARMYNEAAKVLFVSNPEAGAEYAEKALEISKKEGNKKEQYLLDG